MHIRRVLFQVDCGDATARVILTSILRQAPDMLGCAGIEILDIPERAILRTRAVKRSAKFGMTVIGYADSA